MGRWARIFRRLDAYAAGIGLAASWDASWRSRLDTDRPGRAGARGELPAGAGREHLSRTAERAQLRVFWRDPFLPERRRWATSTACSRRSERDDQALCANNSEYFRFTSDSVVSERALREIYLPAFEAAVKKAHVGSIMDSYNLLNGTHATANYHLNVEIAKQQWKFDG